MPLQYIKADGTTSTYERKYVPTGNPRGRPKQENKQKLKKMLTGLSDEICEKLVNHLEYIQYKAKNTENL